MKYTIYYLIIIFICASCGSYTKVSYPVQEALHKGKVKVELTSGANLMFDSLDMRGDLFYGFKKNKTVQLKESDFRAVYIDKKHEYVYRVNVELITSNPEEAVNKGSVVVVGKSGGKIQFDSMTTSNDLFYGYRGKKNQQLTRDEIKEIHRAVKGYLYSVTDSSVIVSQSESKNQQPENEQPLQVRASDIMILKIYRKGIKGKRMLNGALIGLSIGFAFGVTEFFYEEGWFFRGFYTLVFSGIGAGIGLIAGTIGGLAAPEKLSIKHSQEVFKSQTDRLKELSILK